jgi:hypothetical protein
MMSDIPSQPSLNSEATPDTLAKQPPAYGWVLFPSSLGMSLLLLSLYGVLFILTLMGIKQLSPLVIDQAMAFTRGAGVILPSYFFVKLFAFSIFAIGSLALLRLRLETGYLFHWSQQFRRPDPLHVDYHPAEPYSFQALGKWHLYRFLRIMTLPLIMTLALLLTLWVEFLLLNTFMDSVIMRFPPVYIVGLFIAFTLGAFCVAAYMSGIWQSIASTFGACATVTEPFRPLPMLFNRCQRLLNQTPLVWGVLGLKALLGLGWLGISGWLVWQFELSDMLTSAFPYGWVVLALLGLWLAEVAVGYATFCVYHLALRNYYQGLPGFIRDAFTPPASLFMEEVST